MPRIVTRPVIDSIASVTRLSWRSVVLSRHWLRHAKTMIISGMGGCSLCRVLGWGIHSLHVAQPPCLISVLAKVLVERAVCFQIRAQEPELHQHGRADGRRQPEHGEE